MRGKPTKKIIIKHPEKKRPTREPTKKNRIIDTHQRIIDKFYFTLAKPKPTIQNIGAINKLLASMPNGLKQHFKRDLILMVHRVLSFRESYTYYADQRIFQELEQNLEHLRSLNDL